MRDNTDNFINNRLEIMVSKSTKEYETIAHNLNLKRLNFDELHAILTKILIQKCKIKLNR